MSREVFNLKYIGDYLNYIGVSVNLNFFPVHTEISLPKSPLAGQNQRGLSRNATLGSKVCVKLCL